MEGKSQHPREEPDERESSPLEQLETPTAREEFRARLREQFVSGRFERDTTRAPDAIQRRARPHRGSRTDVGRSRAAARQPPGAAWPGPLSA